MNIKIRCKLNVIKYSECHQMLSGMTVLVVWCIGITPALVTPPHSRPSVRLRSAGDKAHWQGRMTMESFVTSPSYSVFATLRYLSSGTSSTSSPESSSSAISLSSSRSPSNTSRTSSPSSPSSLSRRSSRSSTSSTSIWVDVTMLAGQKSHKSHLYLSLTL